METENQRKVKVVAHRIAFLMEHQEIVPDLRELATKLCPSGLDTINRDSPEYLLGAFEAFTSLISALEGKC